MCSILYYGNYGHFHNQNEAILKVELSKKLQNLSLSDMFSLLSLFTVNSMAVQI